jgi:hypothetical protein
MLNPLFELSQSFFCSIGRKTIFVLCFDGLKRTSHCQIRWGIGTERYLWKTGQVINIEQCTELWFTNFSLLAPDLLDLLQRPALRFRNHFPDVKEANKRQRAIDGECSREVQHFHQAEKSERNHKRA